MGKELDTDMYVNTWLRGQEMGNKQHSRTKCAVTDVKDIVLTMPVSKSNSSDLTIEFPTSKDHSKWAVAKSKNWTCVADMNRTVSNAFLGFRTKIKLFF